ncbi:MAG TPA: acyl-CoA dehydrogenase family protein [Mycobacteriales bacterium]|nr:acyl-CoA dehydrogenase family protein [Mycobacteriales bacterium]
MTELDDLRAAVRDLLRASAPPRSALADDPALWKRLSTEMGLTALPVEDVPWSWVTAVVEETGRVLLRSPYLPTVVAAAALHHAGEPVEGLADGSTTAALALDGGLGAVAHAADADVLLVAEGDDLLLVERFTATPVEHLDITRPFASVTHEGGRVVGSASHARDLHWSALAAESVGAAQAVLELAVAHLKAREQFGRPLGSFQALRHRVADLTVLVEAARSSAWYAATRDLSSAPLAKAVAADAFVTVAGECLQLFGGIGFTWEHDAHLYFKRAWTTALTHGDSAALRALAFERNNP